MITILIVICIILILLLLVSMSLTFSISKELDSISTVLAFDFKANQSFQNQIITSIYSLNNKLDMNLKELKTKVDDLQATVDATQQRVQNNTDKLDQIISDLKAQIGAGSVGTPEEVQALSDQLDAISADLKTTLPDPDSTGVFDNTPDPLPPPEETPPTEVLGVGE